MHTFGQCGRKQLLSNTGSFRDNIHTNTHRLLRAILFKEKLLSWFHVPMAAARPEKTVFHNFGPPSLPPVLELFGLHFNDPPRSWNNRFQLNCYNQITSQFFYLSLRLSQIFARYQFLLTPTGIMIMGIFRQFELGNSKSSFHSFKTNVSLFLKGHPSSSAIIHHPSRQLHSFQSRED